MKATLACIPFLLATAIAAQDQTPQAKAARTVAPIERRLDAGVEQNRLGLLTSRSPGTAASHFTAAYDHLHAAQLGLTKAENEHRGEYVYQERLQDLETRIAAASSVSLLNLGSISLIRGQHNKALGFVNTLLAVDPDNKDAKAMRARIEIAANDSGQWVGGSGNVQPPGPARAR